MTKQEEIKMSGYICERCSRESWITHFCSICYRHVCPQCIMVRDNQQICLDCVDAQESLKKEE